MLRFQRLSESDWEDFKCVDSGCFPDDPVSYKLFKLYLKCKGFLGFYRDNELIGYMFLQVSKNCGLLNRLAVKKEEQGKGYGSVMMTYVIDYFHKQGVKKIKLQVESKNKHAIKLYKKFGFSFVNEIWFCVLEKEDIKRLEELSSQCSNYELQELTLGDLNAIIERFPTIDVSEMTSMLEDSKIRVLGLFHRKKMVLVSTFDPRCSCFRSMKSKHPKYLDIFIAKVKKYRTKNYYNIAFEGNMLLAKSCEKRGYKYQRHLWEMEKPLEQWYR